MVRKILQVIFTAIFCLSIAVGGISALSYPHDNEAYEQLQPETFTHEPIDSVYIKEDLQQIYVCYNAASYVNVYTIDGKFLWAISTPELGNNTYFEILNENLVVYDVETAYLYNAQSGAFVTKRNAEELELAYYFDSGDESLPEPAPGDFCFDAHQVYKIEADGSETVLVERPFWHTLVDPVFCIPLTFLAALGIGILTFSKVFQEYRFIKRKYTTDRQGVVVGHTRARFIQKYFRVASIVYLAFAVLDVLLGIFLDGILTIGILPLALHFIVSNAVFANMMERIPLTEDEEKIMNFWNTAQFASFIIAFFSVMVATAFAT